MKTQKMNTFQSLLCIVFLAFLIPACAQTEGKSTAADSPSMDIQTAVISGDLAVVKQHIEAGTDLNETEPMGGSTPLISAATFGQTEIAKALVDAGADLTITNNDGATALHAAAFFCRVEIVQLLLDAEADKSIRNKYGATPRESVLGPFADIKPVYEMMQLQLQPLGLELDIAEIEKTRPVIAMMLQ